MVGHLNLECFLFVGMFSPTWVGGQEDSNVSKNTLD